MKNNVKKSELKALLKCVTGCDVQHTGYPCSTCFFSISKLFNGKDWQALLLFRGDYTKTELDNLPTNINNSLEKIKRITHEKIHNLT